MLNIVTKIVDSNCLNANEMKIVLEAMNKQVLKRAKHTYGRWYMCPNCGKSIDGSNTDFFTAEYCTFCGQKLSFVRDEDDFNI